MSTSTNGTQIDVQLRDGGHQAGAPFARQRQSGSQQVGVKHARSQHHPIGHHTSGDLPDHRHGINDGRTRIRCPEELRRITLEINGIHRDDGVGACGAGTLHGVDSDPATADDDHGVARFRSDADGSRPPPRRNPARHQGGGLERDRLVDLDHRFFCENSVFGERAELRHRGQILAADMTAPGGVGRHSLANSIAPSSHK
jgi:hypothetical protein